MSNDLTSPSSKRRDVEVGDVEEVIAQLPEERREELVEVLVSEDYHSGPVPSPRAMAGYELVSPGMARGLFDMAVRQQGHDHRMQVAVLASEANYRNLTLLAATLVLLTLTGGSIALGVAGQTTAAIALAGASSLAVLAGVILKGRDLVLQRNRDLYREGTDAAGNVPEGE